MRRRGLRGRWLTVYLHRYDGSESTERFHTHPWWLSFGIVLRGYLIEVVRPSNEVWRYRGVGSIGVYSKSTAHRIAKGDGLSLFIGLMRTQSPITRAAECLTKEGFCHYTELNPDEQDSIS